MKIRTFSVLFLLSLLTGACATLGGQPRFSTSIDPSATPLPPPEPGRVVASFPQRITSFDVSPDASMIAVATFKGALIYDFKSRKLLRTLVESEPVGSVAWSSDGSKLAVGSSKDYGTPFYTGGDSSNSSKAHLSVWDTHTWKTVFEPAFGLEMVNEMFRDMRWSPDSRSLAYSMDTGGVWVVDTQTGQMISRQTNFSATVQSITWSPDGSRLLASGDTAYGVRRWRVGDNEAVRLFDPRASASDAVAWSPDGERMATGHYLGTVCLWTAATNKCDGFIRAHRTATFSLAWSPDGQQLATGGGVIRIWDTHTGKLIKAFGEDDASIYAQIEWPAPNLPVVTLQIGLDDPGRTVLRLWDLATGSIVAEFRGRQQ